MRLAQKEERGGALMTFPPKSVLVLIGVVDGLWELMRPKTSE